jgi:hypothetical protein
LGYRSISRAICSRSPVTFAPSFGESERQCLVLLEERAEQVEIVDDLVLASGVDRFVQRLACLHGELLRIDHADSVSNVDASGVGQCGRLVKLHPFALAVCRCRFDRRRPIGGK